MFDIGFSELIVCAIVALVVIGPERMPEAVRTVGLWIGRFKRSLRETRSEIERQIGVDDIRRQLHNEEIMRNLEQARRDMDSVFAETQHAIESSSEVIEREYKSEPDLPYHSHMDEQQIDVQTETQESQPQLELDNLRSSDAPKNVAEKSKVATPVQASTSTQAEVVTHKQSTENITPTNNH